MPGTIAIAPGVRSRTSPERLGAYAVLQRLGAGGMATVYRARRLGEPGAPEVAIKRLHPHLLDDPGAITAFVKEARLALLLDHPAIRRVLAVNREADELLLVMEYVRGTSLLQLLRSTSAAQRLPDIRSAVALLIQLCDVIHYAHERVDETGRSVRFVHRDISPSNLIVTDDGQLSLIDLGVARARVGDIATRPNEIKGKYGYMAPEVLDGRSFDRRADIYSIGVVAWELVTARKLFTVRGTRMDLDRIRARPIEPPSVYNPACPAGLDVIILQALIGAPERRWSTAAMLGEALESIAAELGGPVGAAAVRTLVARSVPRDEIRRPRLARGTTPPVADRPAPLASRPPPIIAPRRRDRTLILGAVLGSFTTAAVALLLGSAFSEARTSGRAAGLTRSAVDAGAADAAADAMPDAAPGSGVLTVPPSAVARLGGPWPKSRTASYPYRARLCIDADGAVTSVDVIDGPDRLESRIEYALRRWRYRPYRGRGLAEPVCFELSSTVRKKPRRR